VSARVVHWEKRKSGNASPSYLSSARAYNPAAVTDIEKTLPLKCPNPQCGKVFPQPLSWFKDNKRFVCTFCNREFTVEFEKVPGLKALLDDRGKP